MEAPELEEPAELLAAMTQLGQELAAPDGPGQSPPVGRVLAMTRESVLVRVGPVVVKAHPPNTDPAALAARVALAAHPAAAGILLPPLRPPRHRAGRWLTAWPHGRTVAPDPDAAPWTAAAGLLARLHTLPVDVLSPAENFRPSELFGPADAFSPAEVFRRPDGLPPAAGPARVARTVAALADLVDGSDAAAVQAAWLTLPDWVRTGGRPPGRLRLCHGDWHFGQMVETDGSWHLCDVDDVGLGDPLWDLGRPAAYRAIEVVTGEEFATFLDAYRAAGGPLPSGPDPWPALDLPARAYAVQTAARALLAARREGAAPDDVARELVAACRRMAADHG